MKFSILLFTLINGIVGETINQSNYENCEVWNSLIKSIGYDVGNDCCNLIGVKCQDSKVISIDLKVKSNNFDLSKLPQSTNLEKFSIKGNVYNGVFPIQLLNSQLYKILDFSNSNIQEIPENIDDNNTVEEIYLNDNQIQKFPYQFQKLNKLKLLNLDNNNITGSFLDFCESYKMPESLSIKNNDMSGQLYIDKNIKNLNIDNNHFNSIYVCNSDFYHSDFNIDMFYAANNDFDDSFFKDENDIIYTSIKELNLSGNENIHVVSNLPMGIEKLNLSSSGLTEFKNNIFNIDTLTSLDISNNTNFHSPIYQFNNQLNYCNFSNTKIKCYEPSTCRNINSNRYQKCFRNKSGTLTYKIYGIMALIFYSYCISWLCICFFKRKLLPPNEETYSDISDESISCRDNDTLPDYNDVIKIKVSPILYSENEASTSFQSQSDQQEPHLPTYEESMDITNLSHN